MSQVDSAAREFQAANEAGATVFVSAIFTEADAKCLAGALAGQAACFIAEEGNGLAGKLLDSAGNGGKHRLLVVPASGDGQDLADFALQDGELLLVLPQLEVDPHGCFGHMAATGMRLAARLGMDRFVGVHVDAKASPAVAVHEPVQLSAPADLDAGHLERWQQHSLLKLLEEARFATTDLQETLPQVILRQAAAGKDFPVFRQVLPEPRTIDFGTLLKAGFALGGELACRHSPGERVGLMLPTAAGSAAAFFATHFAALVPAMINFSSGKTNVLDACKVAQIRTVYTSAALLKKLPAAEEAATALRDAGIDVVMLEQLREQIRLSVKLGVVAGLLAPKWQFSRMPGSKLHPDSEATVLFTSGSEGAPKAVVLTHRNLIANGAQVFARLRAEPGDLLFNSLPVFHTFGMTGGLILPVVGRVRALKFPSPLMYKEIPGVIASEKATIMFSTSTFYSQYARHATPGDVASLRLIVAGGEKLKDGVRATWKEKLSKDLIEGYGVTETAPVISFNYMHAERVGSVGLPVPGIEVRTVPVEGVAQGGSLQIRGPNVMLGKMVEDNPGHVTSPKDGWHDTGDIVEIDECGYIFIVGRAKRFAKIAGEMVPLGKIEEVLECLLKEGGHGAVIAVEDESRGEKLVFATTTGGIDTKQMQDKLQESKLPLLWAPREVVVLEQDEFPLLSTGRTNYPQLTKLVAGKATKN